jgi:hypothetical protein
LTVKQEYSFTFDSVLTSIGFGKYNILVFVIMGLIGVNDGVREFIKN